MDRSELDLGFVPPSPTDPVTWIGSTQPVDYAAAVAVMEARAAAIARGDAGECVWLLEHPPIYTAGTSAQEGDLLHSAFPVHRSGRGGKYTYHGPGQRVAYVLLDLKRRRPDVRAFVAALEAWIIMTLADFGVTGERREDRVGVWVRRADHAGAREDKIAALGIRLRHWVSYHGISINVAPDLRHFRGIVPCGIADERLGVTSLADIGMATRMEDVDRRLRANFERLFGPTVDGTLRASDDPTTPVR